MTSAMWPSIPHYILLPFDKLDTAKMHGLDTSNVSRRVESRLDEPSGIWALLIVIIELRGYTSRTLSKCSYHAITLRINLLKVLNMLWAKPGSGCHLTPQILEQMDTTNVVPPPCINFKQSARFQGVAWKRTYPSCYVIKLDFWCSPFLRWKMVHARLAKPILRQ